MPAIGQLPPAGDGQPFHHFVVQTERVPVTARGKMHRLVCKTMQFLQRQSVSVQASEHDAPAFGAEIDGEIV